MTALPLALAPISAGFAALSPSARELGRRAAGRAAAALAAHLGGPVEIAGRALPALPVPGPGMVRLGVALEAIAAHAVLEVEATLAARLVDRLAGGMAQLPPTHSLTPVERSALELLALVALAGVVDEEPVAGSLVPRLALEASEPRSPLAVEIAIAVGDLRGSGRLLLPADAVRRLDSGADLPGPVAAWSAVGWVASGGARLSAAEVATLGRGDVLLLDVPPSNDAWLRLPGLRLRGRREGEMFHIEEGAVDRTTAELPLEITVEIARVSLTLGDLARLEPGGAVPLHAPRDGRVVLRLGDRPVARGQLVEIEGALGVRVDDLEVRP